MLIKLKDSIDSRLSMLITHKGKNPNSFSVEIGKNPQTTNKILKGLNNPGYDYLCAVMSTYRDVSMEWLLLGEGEMIRKSAGRNEIDEMNKNIQEWMRSKLEDLERKNNELTKSVLILTGRVDELSKQLNKPTLIKK